MRYSQGDGFNTFVEMAPTQVIGEMVLDGGGHFISAGIFGLHTLPLLLAPLVAHARATVDTRTHTGKEHQSTNTRDTYTCTLNAGTVNKPRQGSVDLRLHNRFIYVGVDISMYALLTGGRS